MLQSGGVHWGSTATAVAALSGGASAAASAGADALAGNFLRRAYADIYVPAPTPPRRAADSTTMSLGKHGGGCGGGGCGGVLVAANTEPTVITEVTARLRPAVRCAAAGPVGPRPAAAATCSESKCTAALRSVRNDRCIARCVRHLGGDGGPHWRSCRSVVAFLIFPGRCRCTRAHASLCRCCGINL